MAGFQKYLFLQFSEKQNKISQFLEPILMANFYGCAVMMCSNYINNWTYISLDIIHLFSFNAPLKTNNVYTKQKVLEIIFLNKYNIPECNYIGKV